METEIRLLIVAAKEYTDTVQYLLHGSGMNVTAIDRADLIVDAIATTKPTVIAIDCVTPQMNGPAVFHWLRSGGGASLLPVLLITVGKSQHRVEPEDAHAPSDFVDVPMKKDEFVEKVWALHTLGETPGAFKPPATAPLIVERPAVPRTGGNTVMIVEDDIDHSNLMRNLLETEGYAVVESTNLDAFKTCIQRKPDVIVLDLMMPVVDGFVLCEVFKACRLTRHIPIIFLTALHDAQYVEASRGLQAAAFLTKPVTIANFFFTINMVLGSGSAKAGHS
jgi:DNA-binding response OmpR family regulator